jgi:CRISPR-associated protein Cmr1
MKPKVITATYKIITPMFIGDANQRASDISPASVKGALRFWWRALNWGRFQQDQKTDSEALQQLHQQEGWLFGSSAEHGLGQAKFNLRVHYEKLPIAKADWPRSGSGSGYLGRGLWESGNAAKGNFQAAREYFSENTAFDIEIVLHPKLSEEDAQSLNDALIAWGLLGGLGSRSRRAFGSIALVKLDKKDYQFKTVEAYKTCIETLIKKYHFENKKPPYSAFSQQSSIAIGTTLTSSARLTHQNLGQLFKQHRIDPNPKKRVFGMPYSGGGRQENDARRSSPLLMHIHAIANQYCTACTLLIADFHPDPSLKSVDYSLIKNFLTQFDEVAIT